MGGLIALIVILILLIWLLISCIRIVPQAQAYIVESLGRYKTTWDAGLHLKVPIIERIAKKVSLKEQVLDFLYTYGVENPISGLQNLAATTLRNIIGEMELDQTLTSRDEINRRMEAVLDSATDPWGIKVTRVEIKNIQPPKEIEEVMTKQMRAERERRQTVLEAQAHKEAVVSRAEGDKQAKLLAAQAERDAQIALAEGRARSIELVYNAEAAGLERLREANISEAVLRLKGLDALKNVADGRATKIYMPSDIAGAVSTLGLIGESLGIGDQTPIDRTPKPAPAAPADDCCDDDEKGRLAHEASAATRAIQNNVQNRFRQ